MWFAPAYASAVPTNIVYLLLQIIYNKEQQNRLTLNNVPKDSSEQNEIKFIGICLQEIV